MEKTAVAKRKSCRCWVLKSASNIGHGKLINTWRFLDGLKMFSYARVLLPNGGLLARKVSL